MASVALDPTQPLMVTVQQLGLAVANKEIALAQLQAKVLLVVAAYDALNIDTWTRHVFHESDEMLMEGPLLVPSEDHEALSRFLAAVEELR